MTHLESHQTVRLAAGSHAWPAAGACVVELASMLAGEPFSAYPSCVCPVIAAFMRTYNDLIDDTRRQDLYPYASAIVGSRATKTEERKRAGSNPIPSATSRASPLSAGLLHPLAQLRPGHPRAANCDGCRAPPVPSLVERAKLRWCVRPHRDRPDESSRRTRPDDGAKRRLR